MTLGELFDFAILGVAYVKQQRESNIIAYLGQLPTPEELHDTKQKLGALISPDFIDIDNLTI